VAALAPVTLVAAATLLTMTILPAGPAAAEAVGPIAAGLLALLLTLVRRNGRRRLG